MSARIAIIVAMTRKGVIGKDGALPWSIPEEMAHFKTLTHGATVIMGQKTFENLAAPLAGRTNIVLSRESFLSACDPASSPAGPAAACSPSRRCSSSGGRGTPSSRVTRGDSQCKLRSAAARQPEIVSSVESALAVARRAAGLGGRVWVIGGASVYEQFLPLADEMHVSWVGGDYEGDVYFPTVNWGEWGKAESKQHDGFVYERFDRHRI